MKALGHSYLWWPKLDQAIANWVSACHLCQETHPSPPKSPLCKWETLITLWSCIHIDFAGPFQGQVFLVVVDAFSKWQKLILMMSTTSEAVIKTLGKLFSTHDLPYLLVSDNGLQLTSATFEMFLAGLGIHHLPVKPGG